MAPKTKQSIMDRYEEAHRAAYQIDIELHIKKDIKDRRKAFKELPKLREQYPTAEIKISKLSYKDGCVWSSDIIPDWKFLASKRRCKK